MSPEPALNLTPLEQWGLFGPKRLLIAGPCSAESEEQILETARAVAGGPVTLFRAGIWKPRTRPNSFEGVGEPGLAWLARAREETGLPVACEVAQPEHVAACLRHKMDAVWVGARTTANPFAVQALADALRGTRLPVFVKNPVNPDVELWIGALERINNAGVTRLAAIHRGFSSFNEPLYRNNPKWRLVIELRRRCPGLPVVCDPSHICGRRDLLLPVAQKALDLLADGLMIETHVDPDRALSDAGQQVTPARLAEILAALRFPDRDAAAGAISELDRIREDIDRIDRDLVELLGKRMGLARDIGRRKREKGVPILQPDRWESILRTRMEHGERLGLSGEFMLRVYQYIHEESIRHQEAGQDGER